MSLVAMFASGGLEHWGWGRRLLLLPGFRVQFGGQHQTGHHSAFEIQALKGFGECSSQN